MHYMHQNVNPGFLHNAFKKTAVFLKNKAENREKYIAEKVNKKYNNVEVPPVWPDKIAVAERFVIRPKKMPKNCMSLLDKKNKIIYMTNNRNLLQKWENFALAHVLGKWFLGHRGTSFDPSTVTNISGNKEDFEANKFASHLLMPDNFVQEYAWLEEDFATVFRVPQEIVDFRMSLV